MQELIDKWIEALVPWLSTHGLRILFIIVGGVVLNFILGKIIARAVRIAVVPAGISAGVSKAAEKKREDTLIHIFSATLKITILIIAALMILEEVGIKIGPILAAAGIVGLAFGFGGQYLIRDVISGLFIILENQYRIGDVVKLDTIGGMVEGITLRITTLRDLDGTVHHIPNGEIKKVSNLSKVFARVNLNIGIAYNADLEHVIEVVNRIGKELSEDPRWKESIIKPPQFLRVDELGDSAVVIKILGDTLPLMQWDVTGELRKRILVAFNKEGIEIPFPQRVIHQTKAE